MLEYVGLAAVGFIVFMFLVYCLKIKFIPASDVESAIKVARRLQDEGFVPIINFLGEHYTTKTKVDEVVRKYSSLIDAIKEKDLRAKISVKPTQIGLAISEDFYFNNLHWLARHAYNRGTPLEIRVPLEVDVENLKYLDATLKVFMKIPGYFDIRQAIQAYLWRSWNDIKILTLSRRKIRLVKGAYSESDLSDEESAQQLLELTEYLLRNGCEPAIATIKDKKWIKFACGLSDQHQVVRNGFVFQLLYGLSDKLKCWLRDKGFIVEVYVPAGTLCQGLPYLKRRVKEIYKSFVG